MRNTLRLFAALDLISILFLAGQSWDILTHINQIPHEFLSIAKAVFLPALFISLLFSCAGLFLNRKFALIIYYIQFPFRLILWVFSIGFISYLPELLNLQGNWFDISFKLCFVAEFIRLYYSIKIQRNYF